ncbi:MAG: hypothetical protein PUD65_00740 [Spirochaetales bacterium]|nr:hypothetical protein [Spirochaetales bacterium]
MAVSISLLGAFCVFFLNPFVKTILFSSRKKYRTREESLPTMTLTSKIPSSRCHEYGIWTSGPFSSSKIAIWANFARALLLISLRKSTTGDLPVSVS